MRRTHFEAFRPVCPRCRAAGALHPLHLVVPASWPGDEVESGILVCPDDPCRYEYPILDGIPVIVPDVLAALRQRAAEALLRDDLDPAVEGLLGDALGMDSWLDGIRRLESTWAWDAYAGDDPEEPAPTPDGPRPGAAVRCLTRLLQLAAPPHPVARALDLGCAAGATTFALAASCAGALVLGCDVNLSLLRLARRAGAGTVSYPRRRSGILYDRRMFPIDRPGAARVDFWACDALALPFAPGTLDRVAALNLLDVLPQPLSLLHEVARVLRAGGDTLLATPFDWTGSVVPPEQWIGGHSARSRFAGSGEDLLAALLTPGAHAQSVPGLRLRAIDPDFPWHTRLHDRAVVAYRTHLVVADRTGDA